MGINSSSGAVYGTPTAAGTFNFTVMVTDSGSPQQTASKTLTITVSASPLPGAFTLSNQAPVCDTTPPAGPAVRLNWTASSGVSSYQPYRNSSAMGSPTTGTPSTTTPG